MELFNNILFQITDGLVWGLVVALCALGLTLIFGIMGIINMAHGEMYMAGAMLAVSFGAMTGSFWLAFIMAPLVVALLALPLERWVMRPFEGKPLITMVGTIGLSFIIQQLALIIFGGNPKMVSYPISGVVVLFGVPYPTYRLFAAGLGLLLIAGLWLLLFRTEIGILLRATMEQPEMADAIGINTSMIRMCTFGIGAFLAAAGGVLAAPIRQVFFLMGHDIVLFSFMVVIVEGWGALRGR